MTSISDDTPDLISRHEMQGLDEAAERLRRIAATALGARREVRDALDRLSKALSSVAFDSLFEAELRSFEQKGRRHSSACDGEARSRLASTEQSPNAVRERRAQQLVPARDVDGPLGELSRREYEVLALIADGRSNAGICRHLWISESTVEKHVRSIMMKLRLPETDEVHRRVLAAIAFRDAQVTYEHPTISRPPSPRHAHRCDQAHQSLALATSGG